MAEPDDVPLELLARLSAKADTCRPSKCSAGAIWCRAARQRSAARPAARGGGACGRMCGRPGVAFPLRQAGLPVGSRQIVDAWDRVNDGHGIVALQARVVRQIRDLAARGDGDRRCGGRKPTTRCWRWCIEP